VCETALEVLICSMEKPDKRCLDAVTMCLFQNEPNQNLRPAFENGSETYIFRSHLATVSWPAVARIRAANPSSYSSS
jgi:hypothetical protein